MSPDSRPRIAILSNNEGLGDCIRTLPMLRALKRALPDHRIDWYSPQVSPFARAMRGLAQEYLAAVHEQAPIERPFARALRTLRGLPRYDLVIDTRTAFKRVLMARLFMRYRRFVTGCFGLSWAATRGYMTVPRHHFVERRLDLVRQAIGREPRAEGSIVVPEAARAAAARLLPAGRICVGLAPGAAEAAKCWPLERFIALAEHLAGSGVVPVFLLGPRELDWAPQINVPGAIVLDRAASAEIPPLELTMALGERLAAAVVNDSAACHILAALGTPVVVLYGPTDARRHQPVGAPFRLVSARDFGGIAIDSIPLAAVISAIETLRAEARAAPAPVV